MNKNLRNPAVIALMAVINTGIDGIRAVEQAAIEQAKSDRETNRDQLVAQTVLLHNELDGLIARITTDPTDGKVEIVVFEIGSEKRTLIVTPSRIACGQMCTICDAAIKLERTSSAETYEIDLVAAFRASYRFNIAGKAGVWVQLTDQALITAVARATPMAHT
jgi:hypothetical protein